MIKIVFYLLCSECKYCTLIYLHLLTIYTIFLHDLFLSGCQQKFLKSMQTRDELYSLLNYEDYVQFDQNLLFKGGANDNT